MTSTDWQVDRRVSDHRSASPPRRLRHLVLVSSGLFILATVVPIHTAFGSAAHSMYSDNRTTNLLVLLLSVLPLFGLVRAASWTAFGWAIGALGITSARALGAVAITVLEIRVPATFGDPLLMDGRGGGLGDAALAGDPGYYIGFYLMIAAAAVGFATVIAGVIAHRRGDPTPQLPGQQWIVGTVASVGVTVGLMLPVTGASIGFVDRNLDTGDTFITLAWLVLVCSFAVVGVVGFASKSWWGLGAVAATMLPAGLLYAVYALRFDTANEPGATGLESAAVHRLVPLALCGQAVAIGIALHMATRRARALRR